MVGESTRTISVLMTNCSDWEIFEEEVGQDGGEIGQREVYCIRSVLERN